MRLETQLRNGPYDVVYKLGSSSLVLYYKGQAADQSKSRCTNIKSGQTETLFPQAVEGKPLIPLSSWEHNGTELNGRSTQVPEPSSEVESAQETITGGRGKKMGYTGEDSLQTCTSVHGWQNYKVVQIMWSWTLRISTRILYDSESPQMSMCAK